MGGPLHAALAGNGVHYGHGERKFFGREDFYCGKCNVAFRSCQQFEWLMQSSLATVSLKTRYALRYRKDYGNPGLDIVNGDIINVTDKRGVTLLNTFANKLSFDNNW